MAARRLSDLLQEQQEPFLLLRDHRSASAGRVVSSGRPLLGLSASAATVRKLALRCVDDLAGCFSFPCGGRRFRRLPRADGDIAVADCCCCYDGAGGAGGRQLSPVSVLDLHSDDESLKISHHRGDDDEHNDDFGNPSTSLPSKPNQRLPAKIPAVERFQRKRGEYLLVDKEQEEAVVSAWEEWESIAADIARIPRLVELDLSGGPLRDDWRRHEEEEARQVGQSIEAMIFEEVRWEAVRDMLCLQRH